MLMIGSPTSSSFSQGNFPEGPPLIMNGERTCPYEVQIDTNRKTGQITIKPRKRKSEEFDSKTHVLLIRSPSKQSESKEGFVDVIFIERKRKTGKVRLTLYHANESFFQMMEKAYFDIYAEIDKPPEII